MFKSAQIPTSKFDHKTIPFHRQRTRGANSYFCGNYLIGSHGAYSGIHCCGQDQSGLFTLVFSDLFLCLLAAPHDCFPLARAGENLTNSRKSCEIINVLLPAM